MIQKTLSSELETLMIAHLRTYGDEPDSEVAITFGMLKQIVAALSDKEQERRRDGVRYRR